MRAFTRVFTIIVFIFLYIPMIVLAVASFNTGTDIAAWEAFTFDQYKELFRDDVLLPLLLNSLIIAVISSAIATVLKPGQKLFGFVADGIAGYSEYFNRLSPALKQSVLERTEH